MKQAFVSALQAEQTITSYFLVCEKEIRATREGNPTSAWNWVTAPAPSKRACGTVLSVTRPPSSGTIS